MKIAKILINLKNNLFFQQKINSSVYADAILISVASVFGYLVAKKLVNKIKKKNLMSMKHNKIIILFYFSISIIFNTHGVS